MAVDLAATLIAWVRQLIDDPTGESFTDQEIQEALDRYKVHVIAYELQPIARKVGDVYVYNTYTSPFTQWGTFTITDASGQEVTLTSYDGLNGVFHVNNIRPPLYIDGEVYDVYATVADLLEVKVMRLPIKHDVTADGATFEFDQLVRNMLDMARSYRAMSKVRGVDYVE